MTKLIITKDDITSIDAETIVNSANESLLSGSGLCGLIHKKAGPNLEKECLKKSPCKTGGSIITKAYDLPFNYIIHTVGPKYYLNTGREDELLADCYKNSLVLAKENNIKTIAFPCISTGIYKFPKERAAKIAIDTVKSFIEKYPTSFESITFVVFSDDDFDIYKTILGFE